jgi:hypothetical protein
MYHYAFAQCAHSLAKRMLSVHQLKLANSEQNWRTKSSLTPLKEEFLEKLTMHCSNGSKIDEKQLKIFT